MEKKARNCFVSFHHEYDQEYLYYLDELIEEMNVYDHSLQQDISHLEEEAIYRRVREKMRNCSVTVVLVGERTGHRKWIDWEIWASLRGYARPDEPHKTFRPHGLVAVFLPGDKHSVPDRLRDNILTGYAVCIKWENLQHDFEHAVNHAYKIRKDFSHRIDNSRKRQRSNYRDVGKLRTSKSI